jgi:Arc/MetJ-type ribon-helix-helix transcriptional regulator
MKNVTLAMDETLLEQARGLAERRKTTLNALIRSLLAHEVEQEDRIAWAREGMRRLMAEKPLDLGPAYKWNRDEIYAEREDRMLSRLERSPLRGLGEDK